MMSHPLLPLVVGSVGHIVRSSLWCLGSLLVQSQMGPQRPTEQWLARCSHMVMRLWRPIEALRGLEEGQVPEAPDPQSKQPK